MSNEKSSQDIDHRRGPSHALSYLTVVSLLLVYGTSLLVSQVHSFYKSFHAVQDDHDYCSYTGSKEPLTFALVRNGTFVPEKREIQWIATPQSLTNDSGDYILTKDSKYTLKSVQDPKAETLLYEGKSLEFEGKKYEVEQVVFSEDLKRALLVCNKKHNWRHSFFAAYFIHDVESGHMQAVYDSDINSNAKIALVKWSPDSSKLAFVLENNVYVKDITDFYKPETKQITFDGGAEIFYGKPDWVYEEEVFESDSALWWSPSSEYLAILRSNDTNVPVYPIPYFDQNNNDSYPELRLIKYPKAGYSNPVVDFLVYDFAADAIKSLDPEDQFYHDKEIPSDTRLITEIVWVGPGQVFVKTTNRESDILKIFIVDSVQMTSTLSRTEHSGGGWFEIEHNTLYIPKSDTREHDGYIDVIDIDGYDHLAYFSPPTSSMPKLLTSGKWEVDGGPAAFDFTKDKVYFISTEKSSVERHLYSVNLDGTEKTSITDVSKEGYYESSFSKGSRYLLLNYQGPEVPYQKLVDLHTGKSETLVSNNKLKHSLEQHYELPEVSYGVLHLDGFDVNYRKTLPFNFDAHKKYPLLFFVYGGPGSQLVQKQFSTGFTSVVAAEIGAVVVTVDGRGTGFKGRAFRNIVRDQLSHYEVLDQIAAAKQFISEPYIDEERTAIWGWSYGGFMTLKTLEQDHGETFKYGMSVAPVTDWRLYDSIYTERYMHTPQQNPGYHTSSVHLPDNFRNVTRFLLMHGTGDDNVHFQNTARFLDQLDLAGVENYDLHVFPDSDHSISFHNAGTIVYDKLFRWLQLAFKGAYEKHVERVVNIHEDVEMI